MRLTHIKLAGFKSFTDPTTIHVPGQLVAVIGPNGCGKSNVIDAVRWVLGEASAKQLRGESMQDVIFNGAATRRPAPRASVELVFSNADHSLQGPWGQYAEVSIKRQLTRQGESSYYINNQVVRRRDITDLFLGTGVGARGYAVIEQGMISRIIEARPEELRAYIEEAAGVSKYKERRRETENRLKDTREHLQRLADLQSELGRQVEKLEKQAAQAERYQTLSAQLAQQQDLLDYVQWQEALTQADAATEQQQAAQAEQDALAAESEAAADTVRQLREAEQEQQQYVHQLNKQHAVLREQTARLEEQLRARQNLLQRSERERLAAQAALQKIDQEQQTLHHELAALAGEIEDTQAELEEWALQVAEHENGLPERETAQHDLDSAFQSQQDESNRLKRELALKQQQLAHAAHSRRQHQDRRDRLLQENQALNLPPEADTETAREQAEYWQNLYEAGEAALQDAEAALEAGRQQFQVAAEHHQNLHQQHLTAQAQQQALAQLLHSSQSDGDFWAATDTDAGGELWQHLSAPDDWQHALSVILAERLHARAVPAGFRPPQPLPEGRAAWFTAGGQAAKKTLPAQAFIHQIRAEPAFQVALQHWLDGVLCAPNLDYALERQQELPLGHLWLTPEGHRIDRIGVVLYDRHSSQNLIRQKARHDQLSAELDALAPRLAAAAAERSRLQAALQQQEQQYKHQQNQQRHHAAQLQTAQAQANELLARTNQGQLRRQHIEQELALLEEEQLVLEHGSDGLHDDIAALEAALADLAGQQQNLGAQRQQGQYALKQAQLALLEANRQYGLVEVALHKQQQRRQTLQHQISALEQQALDWQERQTELALAFETEQNDNGQQEQLDILGEQSLNLQEQIHAAQERLQHTQEQGRASYLKQQEIAQALPRLQNATQNALLRQQEALLNAKRFHENLVGRQANFDALAALAEASGSLSELNQDIGRLAQKIQALGAVNLAALEELAEARERDGYYRSQSEDVQAAIALLEEAIAQIDDETKARFKDTFDAVNEKVQTFFPTLFGGGEATLHMVGDDLLSAGVSIMARPPGKKNSTIHLLSGGEKALTAMSLVFALFSLNPAPFCLLDEVDAPLDDANTARFCNLVKEMSAHTQFLYISHNRLTMEMAEQLIGVTMQEKGVSRIVAVDIKQALQMAETA
ncbi:chromosome segregation protein SMC [Neisseria shayeganii]|uniref:Chromosome partition protein Smc n=1 Tax=Neisseria shayeganii 871 TaxID=1032488 RepID=G4CEM4_9NEIS|nr:chromosome segregation protein SMC [Neisseria shayeganii]EGY53752.1 SMC structural maintenance of chromosomes partitioning protein [Neisseria shayeganii 871]